MTDELDPTDDHEGAVDGPASDPVQVRGRRVKAKMLDEQRAAVLQQIMSTAPGRELMSHILHEVCGLYRTTANAAFDPHGQHWREGARAVGLELHNMLVRHAGKQYMVLIGEHFDKG